MFTLEEANAALTELRPIVERMVQHRRDLTAAQTRQVELVTRIAGNGGDMVPSDLHDLAETIQNEADAISDCAESAPGNARSAREYQPRALSRSPSRMCTIP